MDRITPFAATTWNPTPDHRGHAAAALEAGQVLHFPGLAFELSAEERRFLTPDILRKAKNVSLNPATDGLGGTVCDGADATDLRRMMRRYADAARDLVHALCPRYVALIRRGRTSLRPAEIAGRFSSWRKDDTRLHVDSFPSQPTQGHRLLRIFCNVNPLGRPRTWRVGEPFADVARRFWPTLPAPGAVSRHVLALFRVTRSLRSEYDHYMLKLHDAMKADVAYQRDAEQETVHFAPGCVWACFTDQVSHAAMAGQHQFEQTFTLPVEAMQNSALAPISVLERIAGRDLVTRQRRMAA